MKVKIIWFFVFVVLLVNITPIESKRMGGMGGGGSRKQPSFHIGRGFYHNRHGYGSGTSYNPSENMEKTGYEYVLPLPPVPRELMENPKRLKYLAENKNKGKSNIGKALTKS